MACELCARNACEKNYGCFGCVVRHTLNLPKDNRIGYMEEAAERGGHDIEELKAEVTRQFKGAKNVA